MSRRPATSAPLGRDTVHHTHSKEQVINTATTATTTSHDTGQHTTSRPTTQPTNNPTTQTTPNAAQRLRTTMAAVRLALTRLSLRAT